jgi:hypothetical protein
MNSPLYQHSSGITTTHLWSFGRVRNRIRKNSCTFLKLHRADCVNPEAQQLQSEDAKPVSNATVHDMVLSSIPGGPAQFKFAPKQHCVMVFPLPAAHIIS